MENQIKLLGITMQDVETITLLLIMVMIVGKFINDNFNPKK